MQLIKQGLYGFDLYEDSSVPQKANTIYFILFNKALIFANLPLTCQGFVFMRRKKGFDDRNVLP